MKLIKLKQLFLTLFISVSIFANALDITVSGTFVPGDGTSLPSSIQVISEMIDINSSVIAWDTTYTNALGEFTFPTYTPPSTAYGIVYVSFVNCEDSLKKIGKGNDYYNGSYSGAKNYNFDLNYCEMYYNPFAKINFNTASTVNIEVKWDNSTYNVPNQIGASYYDTLFFPQVTFLLRVGRRGPGFRNAALGLSSLGGRPPAERG